MSLVNFLSSTGKKLRKVYFIFLLPLFFVLHGICEHMKLIPYDDAFFLVLQLVSVELALYFLFASLFKDSLKAAFGAFVSLSIFIFFGSIHDFFKGILKDSFLIKYSFFLPSLLMLYFLFLYRLKNIRVTIRPAKFLNLLFVVFISIDACIIIYKFLKETEGPFQFEYNVESLDKPDLFVIVLDGYAGQDQLTKSFGFQNSYFLDSLKALGFFVSDKSKSNYKATAFSTSSLLNMEFLNLKNLEYTDDNLNYCYRKIATSKVVSAFEGLGYEFYNYSIFDFGEEKSIINKTFLISGVQLITSQTLFNRARKDLFNNLLMNHFRESKLYQKFIYSDMENNELLYRKTWESASTTTSKPKFIYTHLMMPHFPYYYNEYGKLNSIHLLAPENLKNAGLYLSYLQGINKRIISLITRILKDSKKVPVIMLLSDHGYRYIPQDPSLFYSNLAAIFLPNKNYKSYYHSISNVNQFRVLFNTLFNQKFSLLPDIQLK